MEVLFETALETKIESLFEYRMFDNLYQLSGKEEIDITRFHNMLKSLQSSIYYLDTHLEENWMLNQTVLAQRWTDIYESIATFGITENDCISYCKHIKRYEAHEIQMRHGKMPERYTMEYFYFYKSCDVKLLRRLIFERLLEGKVKFVPSEWRWFDLITEVNDDIEDLFEDLDFINGNRFLLSIITKGKSKTKMEFESFIDFIRSKNKSPQAPTNYLQESIYKRCLENIDLTLQLMNENLDKFTEGDIKRSRLHHHLKIQ
jgi:hypothetical protein